MGQTPKRVMASTLILLRVVMWNYFENDPASITSVLDWNLIVFVGLIRCCFSIRTKHSLLTPAQWKLILLRSKFLHNSPVNKHPSLSGISLCICPGVHSYTACYEIGDVRQTGGQQRYVDGRDPDASEAWATYHIWRRAGLKPLIRVICWFSSSELSWTEDQPVGQLTDVLDFMGLNTKELLCRVTKLQLNLFDPTHFTQLVGTGL